MIYGLQTLGLKVRFVGLMVLAFPVLVTQWLLASAPWALARLQLLSAGAGLPDTRLWYSPAELQAIFTAWGAPGRDLYLTVLWPSDTGFLLSYGTLLTAAVLYLLKKLNLKSPWWYWAALVPAAAAGFDFAENGLTVVNTFLLTGWEPSAWAEAVCTAGKWVFFSGSLGILVAGTVFHLVRSGWRKLRAGRSAAFEPVEPEEPGRN